jgi:mxaJ protein
MSSVYPSLFGIIVAIVMGAGAQASELRICADPNNLPFSNRTGQGFENKIASLIAAKLGERVSYFWWPQRRGFVRNTLYAGKCDLITGSVLGAEMLRSTIPYYRSSYVFVIRGGEQSIESLDDSRLRGKTIGIQIVGGDNPPPAQALARRGLVANLRGFPVYGDDRDHDPGSTIIKSLAKGDVDVAIVWGPVAGYYALSMALELVPVEPQADGPRSPMVFDITMAVRKGDEMLRDKISSAIVELRPQIDAVLREYGVPRLDGVDKLSEKTP